jgi:hypothetical protein
MNTEPIPPPARPWSWKTPLIFAFVSFQIFILGFRNTLDLWWKPIEGWAKEQRWWDDVQPYYRPVDRWTERYECALGIEQGWCMFAPPVARAAPFLTTRLEFNDGSEETIYSANEFGANFFRVGGWRQRKLEDKLSYSAPSDLPDDKDLPLWSAYVRWRVSSWQEAHPDDGRTLVAVELYRRRVPFPKPTDASHRPEEAEIIPVGHFKPDGTLK